MTIKRYYFWFFYFPLIVSIVSLVFAHYVLHLDTLKEEPVWLKIICYPCVALVVANAALPGVYAFWKRKKHRYWILGLNIVLVLAGGFPGLLLWLWAFYGKTESEQPLSAAPGQSRQTTNNAR